MTVLNDAQYELVLKALRQSEPTPERKAAISTIKLCNIQSLTREIESANQTPALLRRQAE